MLQDFHLEIGLFQIGIERDSSMIGEENGIALLQQVIETIRQFTSGRSPVRSNRDRAEEQNPFRQQRFVERDSSYRMSGGMSRMAVADGQDIRTALVYGYMHQNFRRDLLFTLQLISLQIGYCQLPGFHEPLTNSRRGGDETISYPD